MRISEKEIFGDNKERDAVILRRFWNEKIPAPQVAQEYGLTEQRIYQILENNSTLVQIDRNHAKNLRARRCEIEIETKTKSSKDALDWVEQYRKETEGDKPLIDQRTFVQNVTYDWGTKENTDTLHTTELSTGDSRLPVEVQSSEDRTPGWQDGAVD
jgi:hypothetical protein